MGSLSHTVHAWIHHNNMFPLFLTRATPNRLLKSQVLNNQDSLKKKMLLLSSSSESSKVVSIRIYILADLVKQWEYFFSFFLWDVHPEGTVKKAHRLKKPDRKRERERDVKAWKCIVVYGELLPHRDEWGLSESEKAGRAGIERCLCPTGRSRGFVIFFLFPAHPALVDASGGGRGALWSSTGNQQVGTLPKPASSYPEADHMPFGLSECACRRRKSCRDKSVPGLCIRIHKFILYTKKGAFLRASCAVHLDIC